MELLESEVSVSTILNSVLGSEIDFCTDGEAREFFSRLVVGRDDKSLVFSACKLEEHYNNDV